MFGWLLNEEAKRRDIREKRKRQRYEMILLSLSGFFEGNEDYAKKQTFLNQIQLSWLYCSDDFIRRANLFLDSVNKSGTTTTPEERQRLLGDLLVQMRKDYRCKTSLKSSDFKVVTANK